MDRKLNRSTACVSQAKRPVKVLQFGEGNFLRAFADWILQTANEKGITDTSVAVVSPRFSENKSIKALKEQDGLFHVVLEGISNGEPVSNVKLVDVVADAFSPAIETERYKSIIESDNLRFVISNTTEAGIRYEPDNAGSLTAATFPGKVTAMLNHRFRHFNGDMSKGLIFLCCELIENNGSMLHDLVLRHARENNLGEDFADWVDRCCVFADTLVDRIVPGFPADTATEVMNRIGYDDNLVVKAELYHLWVIGGKGWETVRDELPLDKAGLNVHFMPSLKEFRDRKVRILNGSHTAMVPVALQLGCETVKEAFDNVLVNRFVSSMVDGEVIPTIAGSGAELKEFASGILERFYNPYIKHYLKSISLNSLSKWEARNLPVVADYFKLKGELPRCEVFSFAALMALYGPESGFEPDDDVSHLAALRKAWDNTDEYGIVSEIIGGGIVIADIEAMAPGFTHMAAEFLASIRHDGMKNALQKCCL